MENNIRNFVITAHIDHGKSTLADRLLELTGTIEAKKMQPQLLDMNPLERERGITIKMTPVRINYQYLPKTQIEGSLQQIQTNGLKIIDQKLKANSYQLNLIDTPGHADFGYEVSRALKAVEGAILLIDATQGIQAQTIFNFEKVKEAGLKIIPVINKIDLPTARVEETKKEIINFLNLKEEKILMVSAKTGEGVKEILESIVKNLPAPVINKNKLLKALIFDSVFDSYLGVIAYVRIFDGEIKVGDRIKLLQKNIETEIKEVGIFSPKLLKKDILSSGEIGYMATGLKDITQVRVGETITLAKNPIKETLSGYSEPKPVIFANFYSPRESDFNILDQSLKKLRLNDPSIYFEEERSSVLGRGFKCGFLGMLHLDIIRERLSREFNISPVIFSPSVNYRISLTDNSEKIIYNAEELPDNSRIKMIEEPWVKVDIIAPFSYLSPIINLTEKSGGVFRNQENLASDKVRLKFEMPLDELISNFYDKLKNVTQGYASLSYEISGWKPNDLVKLEILVAGEKYGPLSKIIPNKKAYDFSLKLLKKLKQHLPPQLFAVALQARVGGKIIAREDVSARRKDVTGYLYGGDITRKMKLLEKQKRGKKKLKATGRVEVPTEVLFKLFQ